MFLLNINVSYVGFQVYTHIQTPQIARGSSPTKAELFLSPTHLQTVSEAQNDLIF
jgi:hypothetical protein